MTEDPNKFDDQVDDIINEFLNGNMDFCHTELDRCHIDCRHDCIGDEIPDDDDPLTYEDDIDRIVSDMSSKDHKQSEHMTIVRKQQCVPPHDSHDDCCHADADNECCNRSICDDVMDSEADRQLEESVRARNEKLRIENEINRESRISHIENDLNDKVKNGYFNGVSPVITTSKVGSVATISITDIIGTQTVEINDGKDGSIVEPIHESFILAL